MRRIVFIAIAMVFLLSGSLSAQYLGIAGVDIAVKGIWYDVRTFNATGSGLVDDHAEIEAADSAAIVAGASLYFPPATFKISDNMTLSSHVRFAQGAILSVDAGMTVTFGADSGLEAGLYQIFSGAGTVSFNPGSLVETVYPQWWGATADGATDDTSAIQAAIVAADDYYNPSELFFPKGKYVITSPLIIDRRVYLNGVGFGSQIYQSADEHLFDITPYGGDTTKGLWMGNLHLGSAATTPGKALIYCHLGGEMWFENLNLRGGADGIRLHGTLFNTFRNVNTANIGFFQTCTPCTRWVYIHNDGGSHSNGNRFFDMNLDEGDYGFYIDEGAFEGANHINGCKIEQGNTYGIYVSGAGGFSLTDIHIEAASPTLGITLNNCQNARLMGKTYKNIWIYNSRGISIINGSYTALIVDKFSSDINIDNTLMGGSIGLYGSEINVSNLRYSSDEYVRPGGRSTYSGKNLIDGDMEVWTGGVPNSLTLGGTGNLIAEEGTIVKFGSKSAKVLVGPAGSQAWIGQYLDMNRYPNLRLTNYVSSAYKWTASGSGTNEFYVELAAGGDPTIRREPLKPALATTGGVRLNSTWAVKGTLGALDAGKWDYGDNDSLGYNTIYVRLPDNTDPDTKAVGYVEASHNWNTVTISAWIYKPLINGANPLIGTWNTPTGNHVITAGVPFDEWTRVSVTVIVRSGLTAALAFVGWVTGAASNSICYVDGFEIVDGDAPSPIYDDSRGLAGDFRVGGDVRIGGSLAVDTITPNSGSTVTVDGTGEFVVDFETIYTPSAYQLIDAATDFFVIDAGVVRLNPHGGNWTLTSTPHCADGTEGQMVLITCSYNEASIVTLQDEDTLAGSNLQLGAATRSLTGKGSLLLYFNGLDWQEIGYQLYGIDISDDTNLTAGDALTLTDDTIDFDGGATPAGDLGGTWANPSVDNDSHDHTTTTLSGIDISDDTNLAAGTNVTLVDDTLNLDTSLTGMNDIALASLSAAAGAGLSNRVVVNNPMMVYMPGAYYREFDDKWQIKGTTGADRYTVQTPARLLIDVDDTMYLISSQTDLDLSVAATWDTQAPTDYTVAANRAGLDFYIYAIQQAGTTPLIEISDNSSAPDGYTTADSRRVGGFHGLCVAVGTIGGHALTDFVAGDILPDSVWDYDHRPVSEPEGMVFSEGADLWVDIYLASGTGASTVSVNGGTISDSRVWMDFVDDGAAVKKRLLGDREFQIIASGSNEETNIAGSADPVTTGCHSDSAGRRMISDIGVEDACGAMWQWLDEQSFRYDGGDHVHTVTVTHKAGPTGGVVHKDQAETNFNATLGSAADETVNTSSVDPDPSFAYYNLPGSKGSLYRQGTYGDVKLLAGGYWGDASFSGSRARDMFGYRWNVRTSAGGRFCAEGR